MENKRTVPSNICEIIMCLMKCKKEFNAGMTTHGQGITIFIQHNKMNNQNLKIYFNEDGTFSSNKAS
jgi:hypothetical protein